MLWWRLVIPIRHASLKGSRYKLTCVCVVCFRWLWQASWGLQPCVAMWWLGSRESLSAVMHLVGRCPLVALLLVAGCWELLARSVDGLCEYLLPFLPWLTGILLEGACADMLRVVVGLATSHFSI